METDDGIIKDVKSGDREKFSELVRRHQKALLRLCLRFTKSPDLAEDIVQEAFVKAFQKLHLFEGRSSFKSWLFQIAMNTAKNKLRSQRDHYDVEQIQISDGGAVDRDLIEGDLKAIIQKLVDTLPKKQKTALSLRIYDDLSFKEIAEVMECPYDTAKANYRHAILNIKKGMKETELREHWSSLDSVVKIDFISHLKTS